ncbi:hypothetical protein NQ315_001492 [Exocentrus adspersus]|uniref:Secreted protein n=1 Tax=Exocentrus adspersus TaxID=1586481 RepID=A0AAV8WB07_9CUCU|nr:hypothetical protein NQ315_001492 [Exocentrus adspersus]
MFKSKVESRMLLLQLPPVPEVCGQLQDPHSQHHTQNWKNIQLFTFRFFCDYLPNPTAVMKMAIQGKAVACLTCLKTVIILDRLL